MDKRKVFGAVAGSLMLASSGASIAGVVGQVQAPDALLDNVVEQESDSDVSDIYRSATVKGDFAYTQDQLTPTNSIAYVFGKSILGVCSSLPDYDVSALDRVIAVGGDVPNPIEATVEEMAQSSEMESAVMMCACMANLAGGGVIANAEAAGVSVASLAEAVGA